jgi:hypothetical protein
MNTVTFTNKTSIYIVGMPSTHVYGKRMMATTVAPVGGKSGRLMVKAAFAPDADTGAAAR